MTLLKLTLDTNCIVDLDEDRPNAVFVQELLDLNSSGEIYVQVPTSSASEKQQKGAQLDNLQEFLQRLKELGIDQLNTAPPILYLGISYLDDALFADGDMIAREKQIFESLFPNAHHSWAQTASVETCDPNDRQNPIFLKWKNRLLDAQAYWAHENSGGDIFVTRDKNFARKLKTSEFPNAWICTPSEAIDAINCRRAGGNL